MVIKSSKKSQVIMVAWSTSVVLGLAAAPVYVTAKGVAAIKSEADAGAAVTCVLDGAPVPAIVGAKVLPGATVGVDVADCDGACVACGGVGTSVLMVAGATVFPGATVGVDVVVCWGERVVGAIEGDGVSVGVVEALGMLVDIVGVVVGGKDISQVPFPLHFPFPA
jgi:hypothetical protein